MRERVWGLLVRLADMALPRPEAEYIRLAVTRRTLTPLPDADLSPPPATKEELKQVIADLQMRQLLVESELLQR